ncbi:MAG: hypothetical protein L6Q69_01380 [Zoogloea sp.]|nr:hypothetical protein [Zoogloea sp.]
MVMLSGALLVVLPTWWAMSVRLAGLGQGRLACQLKGLAFALFQLAVMVGLIYLDAWWAVLIYVFLMLATGNMVLEAVALRHPDSALGAWWLRQKTAAGRRAG